MNMRVNLKYLLRPLSLLGMFAIMTLILAACAPATTPTPTPAVSSSSSISIDVANNPTLGNILVDGQGKTLYIFTKDKPDISNCDAACQALWPPLVSSTTPKLGPGVEASLVGSASLANGEKIITYNHMPLYYYSKDTKPNQVSGEDVASVWFVISPAGMPVETSGTATPTQQAAPASQSTPAPITPPFSEASINVANNPTLGNILVGANGLTMYAFAQDTPDTSNCGTACQAIWLPVSTLGTPNIGSGVTASMVGYATLSSGTMILTYNHMPLYYFVNDSAAGQTNGQGFDNAWFAVSPDGNKVGSVAEVTINVANNVTLGSYLTDGNGISLYTFSKDTADTSTCTAACLDLWPPVRTLGKPNLGTGVDQSLIGTIKLADGSLMVTYNHMPLYYYSGDGKSDQVSGQGFKSVWYVIGPDGKPITTSLPAPAANVPTINVASNATLGQYLVDGSGMTLYAFTKDGPDQSNCTGTCLAKWTPLMSQGTPDLGTEVDDSLIGSVLLANGTHAVSYNDMPLYTFTGDTKAGDTNGQGVAGFWYVVSPAGQMINK